MTEASSDADPVGGSSTPAAQPAEQARAFFQAACPDTRSMRENAALAQAAGYRLLATHILPPGAWTDGYYDILGPRAKALLDHPAAVVRDFAAGTLREIEVFRRCGERYGYVFYVLRKRI